MIYRAIGVMSGSSLDGLDIAFVSFQQEQGRWQYELLAADCYDYDPDWTNRLQAAIHLPARDYLLLHADYGHYIGRRINEFIDAHQLHYQVALVASHGHTTYHLPGQKMTAQLGDGSAIAAETQLPVVSDLRALDVALGGQGAPIVPIGEKLLLPGYNYFLNLGGIANLSVNSEPYIAYDVCPANRVLNMLAQLDGRAFDEGGQLAATGTVSAATLQQLNELPYYQLPYPKSLANDFGTDILFPLLQQSGLSVPDALRTCVEHIVQQLQRAIADLNRPKTAGRPSRLLVTGGGAFNTFLMTRLREVLTPLQVEVDVPPAGLVSFKEAIIMAFIGVLRWRQEYNVLSSVTGAVRNSIGGALWTGQEA